LIKKNVLGKFRTRASVEDELKDGEDTFAGIERVPKNYPDGKSFVVMIKEIDGSISRYFAIKINGKIHRTTSLVEV
jgi:hypothetical protein